MSVLILFQDIIHRTSVLRHGKKFSVKLNFPEDFRDNDVDYSLSYPRTGLLLPGLEWDEMNKAPMIWNTTRMSFTRFTLKNTTKKNFLTFSAIKSFIYNNQNLFIKI